jgi:uncharacterized protein (UPF0332 family)
MNLEDCFKQGLLKKEQPDTNKAVESINIAKHFLERANGNYEIEYYDVALICAYNSMLHSARAILFKDGVKERSHLCIIFYLREHYGKNGLIPENIINILDMTRKSRHKTQYGGGIGVTDFEASTAIRDATNFLSIAEKIVSLHKS